MWFPHPDSSLLARLRASTRVAMLVLLVFALKIGTSAACIQHDLADAGLAPGDAHGLIVKAVDSNAGDESVGESGRLAACPDCGCHHASAVPQSVNAVAAILDVAVATHVPVAMANAMPSLELRPPIV